MYTIRDVYNIIYNKLSKISTSAQIETEIILTNLLSISKTEIYVYPEKIVPEEKIKEIDNCLSLRLKYKPIPYIFNKIEFFGLNFYIDESVFIPRQETELLVEEAINLIIQKKIKVFGDIGTGSGNIIISIVKNITNAYNDFCAFAVDISSKALEVAKKNAKLHYVLNRINFILTDKLDYFLENHIKLDLIISNPPYIPQQEWENLQPDIYYEPKLALVSPTGLEFYEYFASKSKNVLNKQGWLILEINPYLTEKICNLFEEQNFKVEKIVKDYNKLPRVLLIHN